MDSNEPNYSRLGLLGKIKASDAYGLGVEIDFSKRYEQSSFYDIESIIKKYGFHLFEINLIKTYNSQNVKCPVGLQMVDAFYVLKEGS